MASYSVYTPVVPQPDMSYQAWYHDKQVQAKIAAYDARNPLGVSTCMHSVIFIYFPILIVTTGVLNVISIWVLQSSFLRQLVIQPLISALLYVHIFLVLVGPLYVWLVQILGIHLTRNQIYPCFFLLWGHNFAVLATAFVLIAMIIERALSIGKPEVFWDIYQKACRNTVSLMLIAALVLAVGGFMCVDSTVEIHNVAYPVCLPWWGNEHSSVNSMWYKVLAFGFSIGPAILILLSLLFLTLAVNRFRQMLRSALDTLNHYNALYLEIRSLLHVKFVKSVSYLGSLFVILCSPVGFFVVFGPVMYRTPSPAMAPSAPAFSDPTSAENNKNYADFLTDVYPHRSFWEYSYLLVSRSDVETFMWILYYSFTMFVTPVLLTTEVLFRREWNGQLQKVARCLQCRKNRHCAWNGFYLHENDEQDFKGPYIARIDRRPTSKCGVRSKKKAATVKVYDAGKTVRAGRKLEGCVLASGEYGKIAEVRDSQPAVRSQFSFSSSTKRDDDAGFRHSLDADIAIEKSLLHSHDAAKTELSQQSSAKVTLV